jgi:hypothetical protein
MQSENTNELSAALAKAQRDMKAATFNRINPHYKNRYADLASVIDAIRVPLATNGLAYTQTGEIREGGFVLVTTLHHSSGQWVASEYPLPIGAKPQELGSALTYARRYSLCAIACIAADDDDDAEQAEKVGQVASTPKGQTKAERETPEDPQYEIDANGDPVANIPWGDRGIGRLGAMDARNDARKASEELVRHDGLKALMAWGRIMGDRVDSWPDHWSVKFRNQFERHKNYLIAKQQQAAE